MKTGLYKGLSDEELVEVYKATKSEEAFKELLKSTENMRYAIAERYRNIPKSEMEDLLSEGTMEMLAAVNTYDKTKNASFKTFLYGAISRHYNDLFRAEMCKKRKPDGFVESFEQINSNSEFDEEGNSLGNLAFSVICEDYSMVEVGELLQRLKLSNRERVVIDLFVEGYTEPEIAKKLGIFTSNVHTYLRRIGNKVRLSGAYV